MAVGTTFERDDEGWWVCLWAWGRRGPYASEQLARDAAPVLEEAVVEWATTRAEDPGTEAILLGGATWVRVECHGQTPYLVCPTPAAPVTLRQDPGGGARERFFCAGCAAVFRPPEGSRPEFRPRPMMYLGAAKG